MRSVMNTLRRRAAGRAIDLDRETERHWQRLLDQATTDREREEINTIFALAMP